MFKLYMIFFLSDVVIESWCNFFLVKDPVKLIPGARIEIMVEV